jgi:hypothetical protein
MVPIKQGRLQRRPTGKGTETDPGPGLELDRKKAIVGTTILA